MWDGWIVFLIIIILTINHFFPSLVNTGGLFATGAGALLPGDGRETGALNGAGPERNAVFLCVCMSDVTFLRPKTIFDLNSINVKRNFSDLMRL